MQIKHYNKTMSILHWLYAVIAISIIAIGFCMGDVSDSVLQGNLYSLHKSLGILALALVIVRLITRFCSKIPQLPDSISQIEAFFAKLGIFLLYLVMIAMPCSGYLMSIAYNKPVPFFIFELPNFFQVEQSLGKTAHSIHITLAYIMTTFIILHVISALKHLICDKTNLLNRIWFTNNSR